MAFIHVKAMMVSPVEVLAFPGQDVPVRLIGAGWSLEAGSDGKPYTPPEYPHGPVN
jgi:hypothetical protein